MAHDIEMQQTVRLVGKVDVVLVVTNTDEGKLGDLHLSKGGIDWWPKNSKKSFHRCTWEQLRDMLEGRPLQRKP